MGTYIQGLFNRHKAEQLIAKHNAVACSFPAWPAIPEDKVLISVVDNGAFDAALVVHTVDEYMYVFDAISTDARHRTFLLMDKEEARKMAHPKNF